MKVLASKGDLLDVHGVEFISEVVDRIHVKVNKVFSVYRLKPKFVQEVWSPKLFALQLLFDFLVGEVDILSFLSVIRHDGALELFLAFKLFVFDPLVARLPVASTEFEACLYKASV